MLVRTGLRAQSLTRAFGSLVSEPENLKKSFLVFSPCRHGRMPAQPEVEVVEPATRIPLCTRASTPSVTELHDSHGLRSFSMKRCQTDVVTPLEH